MKWFHHETASHRDAFIEWLLDEYGPMGYSTFFILLEMMGEKFKPEKAEEPINLRIRTIMERTRIKKIDHLVTILESFSSHPLNKNKWGVKFLNGNMTGYVALYSKKLVDNADRYTQNQLKKMDIK